MKNNTLRNHQQDIQKQKLIAELEDLGIGRPSTYATIVDTLQKRYYAKLQNKVFTPTELGTLVSKITEEYFPDVINTKFTASLENQLDDIAEGKAEWEKTIYDFYSGFRKDVEKAETEMEKVEIKTRIYWRKMSRMFFTTCI